LLTAGYDGALSIDDEDPLLGARDGLANAVALLRGIVPAEG